MAGKPFYQRWRITLGAVWAFGYKMGPRFLSRHGMGHVVPIAEKVRCFAVIALTTCIVDRFTCRPQFCRNLKDQKGFKSLGFVGYCFGGTVSVFLARADSPVDACVCFHPGGPNVAEWEKIAKPFCLVCPEGEFADRGRSCSARRIAHTA